MALLSFQIVVQLVKQQINFNFLLKLILLINFINLNDANQFFDKSVPDAETILTQADFHRVQQRQKRQQPIEKNESNTNLINDSAMYNKEKFEGDILTAVTPAASLPLKNTINEDSAVKTPNGLQRNAVRQSYLKWPRGRIPYTVSTQYTSYGRERIAEAIDEYHKKTCVEWTPKTANDIDYAFSKNGKPTIEPKEKTVTIGQRLGFSPTDLYKVNKLYNCPNSINSQQTSQQQQQLPVPISVVSTSGNVVSSNNKCVDLRTDCIYIANRDTCNSMFSSSFMQATCPKSCGSCPTNGPITTDCNDIKDWCPRWANSGMCDLYIFQVNF
uniref:ShKT domain-containing protein n=1 Tax=Meloidogyne hapla TaxID=6305 RepID=A0A1I8BX64_MELHA